MRCVFCPAIVKILGILPILAISFHIGCEQGPVVDMEDPAQSSGSPITHAQRQNMAAAAR